MALLFTNNAGITATVYRGTPLVQVYGPVEVDIQPYSMPLPERLLQQNLGGISSPTHVMYLDQPNATTYTPMLDTDYIHVTGSTNSVLDGYYSPVTYSGAWVEPDGDLNYIELKVRYLGVKKVGDTGSDNSGVLRVGPR